MADLAPGIVLRDPRPGDVSFTLHRQMVLYAQEYGWDWTFEGLVLEVAGRFIREFRPGLDRCWIAERDGAIVGSVYLAQGSEDIGKLRMLYVEPSARGLGIGDALVAACIAAARQAGYRTLQLWTNDCLRAALRIYERAGFRLVAEERHHSFGHDLVGQTWDLTL